MDASLKRPTASGDDSFGSRGLESKHLFFTNLQLLGFDAAAMEMKYRIPFNKDMFNLPNKTGSEAVLYFLFSRLNPVMCRQEFRDCWPIVDKKSETHFRRLCCMWLQNIQKDEADSNLPRINASLFLSPGGEKFSQLMFYFSVYVLRHVMKTEAGIKEEDLLRRPVITSQNRELFPAILKTVQCESIRNRKILLFTLQVLNAARREWREYSEELVKEIRLLTKRIQELQYRKQKEMHKLTQKISVGSPKPVFQPSTGSDIDVNVYAAECAQRVQQVRKLWKSIEHFIESTAEQREVVSSVINRTQQRCIIDAAEIKVSVPHLLLKECELEIKRRQVDNIYEGGQLNLLSLLHLWNQALIMYINCLHKVGLRDLNNEATHLKTQKAAFQAYISNAASLRETVSKQLPQKKKSIADLRRQFHSGATQSQGLGLQAPSPPVTFDPPDGHSGTTPIGHVLRLTPEYENTPEAAMSIAKAISTSSRRNIAKEFHTTVFGLETQNTSSNNSNRFSQEEITPQGEPCVPLAKQGSQRSHPASKMQSLLQSKNAKLVKGKSTTLQPRIIRHVSRQRVTDNFPAKHKEIPKVRPSSYRQQQPLASTPEKKRSWKTNNPVKSLPSSGDDPFKVKNSKSDNAHNLLIDKVVNAVMQEDKEHKDHLLDPVILPTFSPSLAKDQSAATEDQFKVGALPSQYPASTPKNTSRFSATSGSRTRHQQQEVTSNHTSFNHQTDAEDWNVENPIEAFEQNAFLKHDLIHRSPLEQDIRRMWQDMIVDTERAGSDFSSKRLMEDNLPPDVTSPTVTSLNKSYAKTESAILSGTSRSHLWSPGHSSSSGEDHPNFIKESEKDEVALNSSFLAVAVKEMSAKNVGDIDTDDPVLNDTLIGEGVLFSTSFDEDFLEERVNYTEQINTWEERTSALYEEAEDAVCDLEAESEGRYKDLKSFDASLSDLFPEKSSNATVVDSEGLLADSKKLKNETVMTAGNQLLVQTDATLDKYAVVADSKGTETGIRAECTLKPGQVLQQSDARVYSASTSYTSSQDLSKNFPENPLSARGENVELERTSSLVISSSTAKSASELDKSSVGQVHNSLTKDSAIKKVEFSAHASSSPSAQGVSWPDDLPDDSSDRISSLWALDDSFTPLQSGLFLEGKSPVRCQAQQINVCLPASSSESTKTAHEFEVSSYGDDKDIMARVSRLRLMAAQALQSCQDISEVSKRWEEEEEEEKGVSLNGATTLQTSQHGSVFAGKDGSHYSASDHLDIFDQDDSVLLPTSPS